MRDIATKNTGDTLTASDYNANEVELENAVTSTDQSLDPAGGADTDLNMLGKAMAAYAGAGWGYTASGTANAHVVSIASNLKAITEYFDNLIVAYIPGNINTSTTVTTNVESLGAKNIREIGGGLPAIASIKSTVALILKYSVSAGYFEIMSGVAASGSIVQTVYVEDGEVATGTTVIPNDDSIPQNTEGDEYMTLAITPQNATNILYIKVVAHSYSTVSGLRTVALFKDSDADAIAASCENPGNEVNQMINQVFEHEIVAGGTSSITFKIRIGVNNAGTTTFNGVAGSRIMGGILSSSIKITERKA